MACQCGRFLDPVKVNLTDFLNVLLFYEHHTNIFKSDIMTARETV